MTFNSLVYWNTLNINIVKLKISNISDIKCGKLSIWTGEKSGILGADLSVPPVQTYTLINPTLQFKSKPWAVSNPEREYANRVL